MKNEELSPDVPSTTNDAEQRARITEDVVIQRLIEQALVFQQIEEFPGTEVLATEVTAQISEMQKKAGGAETWNRQLKSLNLELEEVMDHVKWQLHVMKFIDYRFRQFVVVDQSEIESYYQKRLLPDLQKRGVREEPALAEVEEKIRSILTEEKLNLQVDEWLASLRANAAIQIFH